MTTSQQKPKGRLHFPFEDPVESLPATAQKILKAATALLAEKGYEAVTLENVAAAAGVNKASIRYNFGNKAGLIIAVADALIHDECLRMAADVESVPQEERLHAAMVGIRRMIVDADSFRGFFDILPHAFRDPELRVAPVRPVRVVVPPEPHVAGPRGAGCGGQRDAHGARRAHRRHPRRPVGAGGAQPRRFELSRPLATLEFLLRNSMVQLLEIAASAGAEEAARGPPPDGRRDSAAETPPRA